MPYAGLDTSQTVADGANCKGYADIMVPEKPHFTKAAKKRCAGCGVRSQCLAGALDRGDLIAVFGGMTGDERNRWRGAWTRLTGKARKKPGPKS